MPEHGMIVEEPCDGIAPYNDAQAASGKIKPARMSVHDNHGVMASSAMNGGALERGINEAPPKIVHQVDEAQEKKSKEVMQKIKDNEAYILRQK